MNCLNLRKKMQNGAIRAIKDLLQWIILNEFTNNDQNIKKLPNRVAFLFNFV